MITLSIDVTKIDKARLVEGKRKNDGSVPKYLNLVLFESESEYGDYIVKQSVTKEERKAKKEMPILGNAKKWERQESRPATARQRPQASAPKPADDEGDDVPF